MRTSQSERRLTGSHVDTKLGRDWTAFEYSLILANLGCCSKLLIFSPCPWPSGQAPRSFDNASSRRPKNGAIAISAMENSPMAKPVGGKSAWICSNAVTSSSGSAPVPRTWNCAGLNLLETASMKRRALARRTGSLGRMPDSGKRSATNSTRTRDSGSLTDSGDGWSGGTSGPP